MINASGKVVFSDKFSTSINVSQLKEETYILNLIKQNDIESKNNYKTTFP